MSDEQRGQVMRKRWWMAAATLIVKWFPDKRGMAAGLATMGFGAGSVLAGPAGEALIGGLGEVPPVFGPDADGGQQGARTADDRQRLAERS